MSEERCMHELFEINWEGRAECECGHSWWATADQIKSEFEADKAWQKWCRRQERIEFFHGLIDRVCFWRRWRRPRAVSDDEIPF